MDAQRRTLDDIQPLKIRLRQVFSGNGDLDVAKSVYCPSQQRSVSVGACNCCSHGAGVYEGPGDASVLCDQPGDPAWRARAHTHAEHSASVASVTPVSSMMTTNVLCVRADVSLEALTSLLLERGISGVPVVDAHGAPVGIISKTDLVRYRHENGENGLVEASLGSGFHTSSVAQALVADLMTPLPVAMSEDASIAHVAAAMAHACVHRLPIVAEDGKVVGIVSSLDIVRWFAQREGQLPDATRRKPTHS